MTNLVVLQHYFLGRVVSPSIMYKARSYSRVEHLKDASLNYAPALLEYIRIGWKGLPGTNTLAYSAHS
jgi:hypothetical protein